MKKVIVVSFICFAFYVIAPVHCRESRVVFPSRHLINGITGASPSYDEGSKASTCYTNEGVEGICLPIRKCPELRDLIQSQGGIYSKEAAVIFQSRVCKHTHRDNPVCCLLDTKITTKRSPLVPSLKECGIPKAGRITKGEEYKHGAHPWLVGVGFSQPDGSIDVKCGGTLITKKHVLTAAHCFIRTSRDKIPQFTHVILGEHSLSKDQEKSPPVILQIAQRKNPGYEPEARYRDIELLVLEEEVTFSNYIKPACLPFDEYVKHFDLKNQMMTIIGWGKTSYFDPMADIPREAMVAMIPLLKCQKDYESFNKFRIDKTQMCLGGDGRDTCRGDSGGPVLYKENVMFHRHFLVGITAYGPELCGISLAGVYTYVPAYMDWILRNL